MDSIKSNFPPTLLVQLRSRFFHPFTLDVQFQSPFLTLQMIANQLKGNIILGWLLYVIRSFLQVGFRFQYQLTILSGCSLTSFHLAEANLVLTAILKNQKYLFLLPVIAKRRSGVKVELNPHYLIFRGSTFLCLQLSKNITKCFLKQSFF